jgi:hypothetical protein
MKPTTSSFGVNGRALRSSLAALPALSGTFLTAAAEAQTATPGYDKWNGIV